MHHDVVLQIGRKTEHCSARWEIQQKIIDALKNTELNYTLHTVSIMYSDQFGVKHNYSIAIMDA